MIKEALQYINNLSLPHIHEVGGLQFTDKKLTRINTDYAPGEAVYLTSLEGFWKAVRMVDMDNFAVLRVIVRSDTLVVFEGTFGVEQRCCLLVKAVHEPHPFSFGQFFSQEQFLIELTTKFDVTEDRDRLLTFASHIDVTENGEFEDDGVSQKVVIRRSVANHSLEEAPKIVSLKPRQSFPDIPVLRRNLNFRMKRGRTNEDPPQLALFEIDNGEDLQRYRYKIAEYLAEKIEPVDHNFRVAILV